jgi:hypothetical protein
LIPLNKPNDQAADNQAPLEPVEEVFQVVVPPVVVPKPVVPEQADHVLAMDDLTGASKEELPMPHLIDDLEVVMPNMQNP